MLDLSVVTCAVLEPETLQTIECAIYFHSLQVYSFKVKEGTFTPLSKEIS